MAWTESTRTQYERHFGRYASDLTDQEWELIAPVLPSPKPTGRPRSTAMRDVIDAILYIASTGCAWRMLPNDFPPVSTVRYYFYGWRDDGIFEMISHLLVVMARELLGRKPRPSAGVVDSQSIKQRKVAGYRAMMQANGSRAASAISSPTRSGSWSGLWCIAPQFRTETGHPKCSNPSTAPILNCVTFLRMAVTPGRNCVALWPVLATGQSRL